MVGNSAQQGRAIVSGHAVVVGGDDIDTDRIIPARFAKAPTFSGLGVGVFADDRLAEARQGGLHPFDNPCYAQSTVMFVNKNFGCGSSREHAVAALMRWQRGIRAIVGESFAEIFFNNCLANGLPAVTADAADIQMLMHAARSHGRPRFRLNLNSMTVTAEEIMTVPVDMPADARARLIDGSWDTLTTLLAATPRVTATANLLPYLNGFAA